MTNNTPEMPKPDRPDLIGFAMTYPSGTGIGLHSHEAHQLIHAISGAMRVSALGKLWFLPVGRALWIPADIRHSIRCEGQVDMRTVYLSKACPSLPSDPGVISVSALVREVLVRLTEHAEDELRNALREVLIHEIRTGSVEAYCLPLPADPRIARLAEDLRSDPASGKTLRERAKELGFSERNLIRRIREETGLTFREIRRQTRVMVAVEKLVQGQTVTNVAFDVGFETPSAFISAFRSVTGQTPRQFVQGGLKET